jgi:hypothetical protein
MTPDKADMTPKSTLTTLPNEIQQIIYFYAAQQPGASYYVDSYANLLRLLRVSRTVRENTEAAVSLYGDHALKEAMKVHLRGIDIEVAWVEECYRKRRVRGEGEMVEEAQQMLEKVLDWMMLWRP